MLRWTSLFPNRLPKGVRRKRRNHSTLTRRLAVEPLEDRRMLAMIIVNSAADNVDVDGVITLREAIIAANADAIADATEGIQTGAGDDVIQFAAALNGATITLDHVTLGPLDTITEGLEIDASALSMGITINGNDPSAANGDGVRIFDFDDGTGAEIDVAVNNLTLTDGDVSGDGGAIRSLENLTVIDSVITGNRASNGGGIYSDNGALTITDSTISENNAGNGGGIQAFDGTTTITNSTISGNAVSNDGGGIDAYNINLMITNSTISENNAGGDGGGIYLDYVTTTITDSTISGNSASDGGGIYADYSYMEITDSTISGNDAGFDGGGIGSDNGDWDITSSTISGNTANNGGGIFVRNYYFTHEITNSTISGNMADNDGGGIDAYLYYGTLTIRNSTITNNTSNAFGVVGSGGGLYLDGYMGTVTLENTIISGNTDNTGAAPDIDNTSANYNASYNVDYSLIGDNTGSGLAEAQTPDANGNLIGTGAAPIDPLLGPLQDNGGPTFTHALAANSLAIDAGDPGFATPPNFDQRGAPFDRVVDGDEDFATVVDIGAFEFIPPPPPIVLGSPETVTLSDFLSFAGDLEVYQYTAHSTGKLIVRTYFDPTPFMGLFSDFDLQVVDQAGNIIATSSTSTSEQGLEEIIIPVVFQERYFIHVLGVFLPFETTNYTLEIENFPAPVPTGVHLDPASDTGMMNNDGVTNDTMPTFFIQTDVLNFVDTNNNGTYQDPDTFPPATEDKIDALSAEDADELLAGNPDPEDEDGGIAVEVTLVNTSDGTFVTGFAEAVIGTLPDVYRFTPDDPLSPGVYLISARTKVWDGQKDENADPDQQMGRSNASPPLWITIDTEAPFDSTFDLLPFSDSGMYDYDRVTNKMQPAFTGFAEPNAKVSVFAQRTDDMGIPIGFDELVGKGVVDSDGLWEVTVEPLIDGKYNFWADFEDLAGNFSDPVGISASETNNTAQAIPDNGMITSTIDITAADFAGLVGDALAMNVPVIDVNVTINIDHTFDADLDIFLISPTGTPIELSTDNGGSDNNYTGTIFDDAAGISIVDGTAPFTGRFRPEEELSTLFNETALGTWTLEITDDLAVFAGELLNWTLEIETPLMVVIDTVEPNTPFLDLVGSNDNVTNNNMPTVTMTSTDPNIELAQLLWQDNLKFRIYDRYENTAEFLLYDSALDTAVDNVNAPNDMFTALALIEEMLPEQYFNEFGTNDAVINVDGVGKLADGMHNLKLEVEDRAGNISHDFLLKITVDTSPQLGVWSAGEILIGPTTNSANDYHSHDTTSYLIGTDLDYIFAGKFSVRQFQYDLEWNGNGFVYATGSDTLAAYGRVFENGAFTYRWLIDQNGNGFIDPDTEIYEEPPGTGVIGIPVAGNFDGNPWNGDEVGLFDGQFWYFDTDHDFNVSDETPIRAIDYSGFPIAGDFDGDSQHKNGEMLTTALIDFDHDGDDDVATYIATSAGGNLFSVDINTADPGDPIEIDGIADYSFHVGSSSSSGIGFSGVRERPVSADFNGDGIDDFGLWVPDGINPVPNELSEWYLLLSGDAGTVLDRIIGGQGPEGKLNGFVPFTPESPYNDIYAQFGNTFSLPVVGKFYRDNVSFPRDLIVRTEASPTTTVSVVSADPRSQQSESPPVVESPPAPAAPTVVAVENDPPEDQPVEQTIEVAVAQVTTEVVPETPLETREVSSESSTVEQVAEHPIVETERARVTKRERVQSSLQKEVAAIVETEVATPESPEKVVAKQEPAEPKPEVVAASKSVVVKVTTAAPAEEIPVAPVYPPVQPHSRSRVRSLSYGGSRTVASVSTQSIPPPVVKPAEPQPPAVVEFVVEIPTSKEVLEAPAIENTTDLQISEPTQSIPDKTTTPVMSVPAPDPITVMGDDTDDSELSVHRAPLLSVSEQPKGNETDSQSQDPATDLNVSPSTSRRRTRTLIYVQGQSNDRTSAQTPNLATAYATNNEQLAYSGALTNDGVDPTQEKTAITDAVFDNASQLEFIRIDAEVVDELSRLIQNSTEEFGSKIQHESLAFLTAEFLS